MTALCLIAVLLGAMAAAFVVVACMGMRIQMHHLLAGAAVVGGLVALLVTLAGMTVLGVAP